MRPATRPAYEELREQVRNAPVVTADEAGWRVGGVGHWLWSVVTPTTTVYAICAGRGFDDAQAVLGPTSTACSCATTSTGVSIFSKDHPHCRWPAQVQDTLQAGLALRDRRNAGSLSAHGLATARGRLLAQLSRLIDKPPPHDDAERFAAHLANRIRRRLHVPVGPVGRRHQLARRTTRPARRRHPQGVRRQPHPKGCRHPTGSR